MSNNYTDICATNPEKRNSRYRIAQSIKNSNRGFKVIHYLGGKNETTPFENKFQKKRTTFIRYEMKRNAPVPKNYLSEKDFDAFKNHEGLLKIFKERFPQKVKPLESLIEEFQNMNGCFVNQNVFSKCWKYLNEFGDQPHYFWLDFCGAPTPQLLKKIKEVVTTSSVEETFVTFYMNPRGKKSVEKITEKYGRFLHNRAVSLCEYFNSLFKDTPEIKCEIFDTYVNGISPMCVIKISRKKKNVTKKTIKEYAKASKRFSNKQLAVLWKMPIMKIAGLAAAAKRKKLI
jgi:hypothetical protein